MGAIKIIELLNDLFRKKIPFSRRKFLIFITFFLPLMLYNVYGPFLTRKNLYFWEKNRWWHLFSNSVRIFARIW